MMLKSILKLLAPRMILFFILNAFAFNFSFSLEHDVQSTKQHNKSDLVYGEDDRVEPYQVKSPKLFELSRSVASMIDKRFITIQGKTDIWSGGANVGKVILKAPTLFEYLNKRACSDEKFINQLSAADCTGFLISPRLIVTAGHCVTPQGEASLKYLKRTKEVFNSNSVDEIEKTLLTEKSNCQNYSWVFGYEMIGSSSQGGQGKLAELTNSNVYNCKKVISYKKDDATLEDFAIVELDRPVLGRAPLAFNPTGAPKVNDPLVLIGNPIGIPLKIAAGANVRSVQSQYFVANLDSYGGNSGSPVINTATNQVEGILVRGNTDFKLDPIRDCVRSNVLDDLVAKAEQASNISQIFKYLPDGLRQKIK